MRTVIRKFNEFCKRKFLFVSNGSWVAFLFFSFGFFVLCILYSDSADQINAVVEYIDGYDVDIGSFICYGAIFVFHSFFSFVSILSEFFVGLFSLIFRKKDP